jgi:cytochrome c peroxidase
VLFYDKNLSHNNSVSCSSCHQQLSAFCDNQKSSPGLNGVRSTRNTPGIFNKRTRAFWDGRAENFTLLALMPVSNHFEMGIRSFPELAAKLQQISYYPALVTKAFGDARIDSTRLNEAISSFISAFMFSNTKFRRSLLNTEQLSATESMGKDLFFGKAGCFQCHKPSILDPGQTSPYSDGFDHSFVAFNIGLDPAYTDQGVGKVTEKPEDNGKFMIPSLLNVEYTYPYMHDGRYQSLEEVVEHYNSGVAEHPCLDPHLRDFSKYPGQDPLSVVAELDKNGNHMLEQEEAKTVPPKRLNLSDAEKRQLVAFLKTLSDPAIKSDIRYGSPFIN